MDRFCEVEMVKLNAQVFHKVFLTALMLAAKYNEDSHFLNDVYCRIGGVRLDQINDMEKQFLIQIGYRLFVKGEDYRRYFFFVDGFIKEKEN